MAQGGVQLGEEDVCFCGFETGFYCVAGLRSDLEHLSCTSTHLHSQQTLWSEQSKDSAGAFTLLAELKLRKFILKGSGGWENLRSLAGEKPASWCYSGHIFFSQCPHMIEGHRTSLGLSL